MQWAGQFGGPGVLILGFLPSGFGVKLNLPEGGRGRAEHAGKFWEETDRQGRNCGVGKTACPGGHI